MRLDHNDFRALPLHMQEQVAVALVAQMAQAHPVAEMAEKHKGESIMPSAKYCVTREPCPHNVDIRCADPSKCAVCGWNPKEIERRKRLRETYGLSKGSDGLKRLVIPEEVR